MTHSCEDRPASFQDEPWDVAVLGAGPAGTNAAIEAARHGLSVVLINDADAAGGQVWRAPATVSSMRLSEGDPDRLDGDAMRSRLAASSVHVLNNAVVWSVHTENTSTAPVASASVTTTRFRVEVNRDGASLTIQCSRIVAALGAVERVVPFPGWTLPGVFGLAAATAMLKSDGCLPGNKIVIAGQGPLLMAVAAKTLSTGRQPQLLADAAQGSDWLRAAIGFAGSFSQLVRGAGWIVRLIRARVPYTENSVVIAAHGQRRLKAVEMAPLSPAGVPLTDQSYLVEADTLFIGNGLSPVAEVPRLLGATIRSDALRGGFSVVHDGFGRTSIPGLLVAGDGAGVRGAAPSAIAGTMAGLACAVDAQRVVGSAADAMEAILLRRYLRTESCADASCRLMQIPTARMAAIPDDTIICRCEQIDRSAINSAARKGARHMDELKTLTRLGMGACQGRMCAINAACLLSIALADGSQPGMLTQRIPLRPLAVDQLVGNFTYDDIPVPQPAPL